MSRVGGIEDQAALRPDRGGGAEVDRGRGVVADARVAVVMVVGVEEVVGEGAGVLERAEAFGEGGAVLEGLEAGLAVGVVVRYVGPGVGASDARYEALQRGRLRFLSGSPLLHAGPRPKRGGSSSS
jgi:hypothetical protein